MFQPSLIVAPRARPSTRHQAPRLQQSDWLVWLVRWLVAGVTFWVKFWLQTLAKLGQVFGLKCDRVRRTLCGEKRDRAGQRAEQSRAEPQSESEPERLQLRARMWAACVCVKESVRVCV